MFPNDYDLPHDIWKLVLLHVHARDICAFRAVDKEASRVVAPFVPHTQGPITHCMKPMNKGHTDAFVWTIEQYDTHYDFSGCSRIAAKNGHLDILRALSKRSLFNGSSSVMDLAAKNGHLEIVQWLKNIAQ